MSVNLCSYTCSRKQFVASYYAESTKPHPMQNSGFLPPLLHTGGLLSTTSGAHGRVQSRDGEELSTPAMKRRRVHEETSMSLVSGLGRESVHCELLTPPRHVNCQHQHPHPQRSQHPQHNFSKHPHHPSPQHQSQHDHHCTSQPPVLSRKKLDLGENWPSASLNAYTMALYTKLQSRNPKRSCIPYS